MQVAFNLPQRCERLRKLLLVLRSAGEPDRLNQVPPCAAGIFKPRMARQDQQILDGGGHNYKLSPILLPRVLHPLGSL